MIANGTAMEELIQLLYKTFGGKREVRIYRAHASMTRINKEGW
jgi:hypothetical protein